MNQRKKVLLLCGSHNDLGMIKSLKKLGFYIILTGNIPNQPGQKYADEYIQADYSDKEAILQLAIQHKIDAICQSCNDFAVYTASYVAEKLNLPGYDNYETTLLLHNKDRFKMYARKEGIKSAAFYHFTEEKDALHFAKEDKTIQFPVIVKPSDASAGNGILKVDQPEELKDAISKAFATSRNKIVLIEQYITGSQHGFCTFLRNKKVAAYSSNNEYSFLNPYRVEIDTFPAEVSDETKQYLIQEIEKIAEDLQLKDGIFHLQYRKSGSDIYIIEVMRRILGNMYSVPANLLTNFDWDYWEARAKCGLSCDLLPQPVQEEGYFAYKTIVAPKNGVISSINLPKEYEPYVVDSFYLKKPGDKVERFLSEPLGFLFFQFSSAEEMEQVLIHKYTAVELVEIIE